MNHCQKRLALALGGGGARGLAHVGIIQVLHEAGIVIDAIAGTSVGSLIGVALAAGRSVNEITSVSLRLNWLHLARLTWPRRGFISFSPLERFLNTWLGDISFSDLNLPFVCVATDALTGKPTRFDTGRVAPCIRASCTVPPVVQPMQIKGRMYVDGGITDNLPIQEARALGAEVVMAVNLFGPPSFIPTGYRAYQLAMLGHALLKAGNDPACADVLVEPDLTGFSMVRFRRDELIALGRGAMIEQLPQLQDVLFSSP